MAKTAWAFAWLGRFLHLRRVGGRRWDNIVQLNGASKITWGPKLKRDEDGGPNIMPSRNHKEEILALRLKGPGTGDFNGEEID